jgi:hypothetical protein
MDVASNRRVVMMVLMCKTSATDAKAPAGVAVPRRRRALREEEARRSVAAFIDELSAAEPRVSAVEDLILSRR